MFSVSRLAERNVLDGRCDLYVDGNFVATCRCSLDFDAQEFLLEHPTEKTIKYDADSVSIRNATFVTQTGLIAAQEVITSFAVYSPTFGGSNISDSALSRTFDAVRLAPVWRFICNEEIVLKAEREGFETYLRPGCDFFPIDLSDDVVLKGSKKGISFLSEQDFDNQKRIALELALGGPIKIFARQVGCNLSIRLNEWCSSSKFRSFFDRSKHGVRDRDKEAAGFQEIYRKALIYQAAQADGGENFRYAVEAFIKTRSSDSGFVVQMLGAVQMLEWLDRETTIKHQKLAERFGISEAIAKAIMVLRNEFFHNPKDETSRKNLLVSVRKAGEVFQANGLDVDSLGNGNRDTAVLNYVVSLAGCLLMREIAADVTPTLFIPGHGEFVA